MSSYSYLYITVPEVHENDALSLLARLDYFDDLKPTGPEVPGLITLEGEAKSGDYYLVDEAWGYINHEWQRTGPPPMLEWVEKGIPFDIRDDGDGGDLTSRLTFWRPGMEAPESRTTHYGHIVINLTELEKLGSYEAAKEYLSEPPPMI